MADEQFKVDLIADAKDVDLKIKQSNKKLAQFSKESAERGKAKIRVNIARLQIGLDKARAELRKFKKEGDKVGEIQARLKIQGLQQNITNAKKQLKGLQQESDKTKKSFFNLGKITKDLIKTFGALYIIRSITRYFKSATQEAIAFESAFAGVRKTTEATEKEFAKLEKGFVALSKSIPLTASELAKIGEIAGQLGVAKGDLIDFTKTIADIGVTSNLTEEEAAIAFARIANIYQQPAKEVENLASAVIDLGNNFATTEKEIVQFATRIAGSGKVVGLTTADIVAIGTAFTSVGVEASAGGTAVQKTLFAINDAVIAGGAELTRFAEITGQSADEFAKKWRADPAKAFNDFILGLGTSGDKGGKILEELVAGDVRLQRAFLSLASAGDLLTKAIDTSSEAYIKNTALLEEAEKRYDTNESKLKIQKNRWDALNRIVGSFILKGLVPVIKFFTDLTEDLVTGTKNLGYFTTAVKVLLAVLVSMIALKVGAFFASMATAVSVAGGAVTVLTGKIVALKVAILAVPLSIPIVATLIGGALVFKQIRQLQKAIGLANDATQNYADSSKKSAKVSEKALKKIRKENEELAKSDDSLSKKKLANNKKIEKAESLRLQNSIKNQQRAFLLQEKANLNMFNDFKGRRRNEIEIELESTDKEIKINRSKSREIIKNLDDESKEKAKMLRGFAKEAEDILKDGKEPPTLFPPSGSIKKGSKEAKDALKDYEKAIDDTDKATEQLAKNTEDYYDDIIKKIQDAKNEQQKLKEELATFETEEQKGFLRDTAERQVELINEEKEIRKDITKERAEDEENQERINDLNDELNKILAERKEIQTFIDVGGQLEDYQSELERATERANASSFGLAKLNLEERLELKRKEIQEEINKQQKILDIQQQFYDLQNAIGKEADEKRAKLAEIVEGADEMTPEERKQALLDLGFAEIDAEGQIELLKQAERFKALEVERKEVENQQQQILDVKKEYFALAEEAHKESTEEMIKETDALIARINEAIQAQLRLRALGGSPVPTTDGSTTNVNITNNNASGVDVDSAMLSLTNKINQ